MDILIFFTPVFLVIGQHVLLSLREPQPCSMPNEF